MCPDVGFKVNDPLDIVSIDALDSLEASIGLLDMTVKCREMIRYLDHLFFKRLLEDGILLDCVNALALLEKRLAQLSDNAFHAAQAHSPITQAIIERRPSLLEEFMLSSFIACSGLTTFVTFSVSTRAVLSARSRR